MRNLIQKTYLLSSKEWQKKTLNIINKTTQNKNNILICGGETVKSIYRNINIKKISKKKFILGDERDVSLNSKNSNYNSIKKNLFKNKINKNKFIFFDIEKNKSKKEILDEYINKIPKKIGASIFSFAEDGHVFSLFFNEKKFKKENKKAIYTIKKKTFQDFPFLRKLLIVLSFILFYAKASSATNFSSNKKKLKKVFLDIQKYLKSLT
tara:strand:+ start:1869 stop:2495 length:627 start_codon:yes stop_codon:yes gene_type:complete